MLTFNEYQKKCSNTDVSPTRGIKPQWLYYVLVIGGECGELLEHIKKFFRDDGGYVMSDNKRDKIIKEMGDINWYLARLCTKLNIKFEEVFQKNLDKLQSRKDRGELQGDGDNR